MKKMMKEISKKLIKPHTPTPQNLKSYHISFTDQIMWPMNNAVILFYQSKPDDTDSQLEESLAEVLVQFYPLAGRYIKNDGIIDCGDQGAEFVRAEALDVELLDLVGKTEIDQLELLLPDQYSGLDEAADDPLVSIKATHFSCGGVTIAVSVSHRVFDISSLGTFIAVWSSASNPLTTVQVTPSFELPSLLPCKGPDSRRYEIKPRKIPVKTFLFNKAALTSLRSKTRLRNGKTASGVRVVCAALARALIRLDRAKHGRSREVVIFQPVNLRERTIRPLPRHACGNFSFASLTRYITASEAEEIGMQELVDLMGDGVRRSIADRAEILSPDRDGREIIINTENSFVEQGRKPDMFYISFTDWSRFGFDEADFGWGEPVWTSIGPQQPRNNATVLMSNKKGDGIEAWVHLNEDDMRCFEQDEEIKTLTS